MEITGYDVIAYHQGELAYYQGMIVEECPYPADGREAGYWRGGWENGKKYDRPEWKALKGFSLIKVNYV